MSSWSVCQSPPISDTLRLGLDGDQVLESGTLMRGTEVITDLEEGLYIAQYKTRTFRRRADYGFGKCGFKHQTL